MGTVHEMFIIKLFIITFTFCTMFIICTIKQYLVVEVSGYKYAKKSDSCFYKFKLLKYYCKIYTLYKVITKIQCLFEDNVFSF